MTRQSLFELSTFFSVQSFLFLFIWDFASLIGDWATTGLASLFLGVIAFPVVFWFEYRRFPNRGPGERAFAAAVKALVGAFLVALPVNIGEFIMLFGFFLFFSLGKIGGAGKGEQAQYVISFNM